MKKSFRACALIAILSSACASQQGAAVGDAPAPPPPKADRFETDGFSVARPEGWEFVAPDTTMAPDTVAVIVGPLGNDVLAPVVEIGSRTLDASTRQRKPEHVLTAMVLEIVQTFAGFDAVGSPQSVTIAGKPAALVKMSLTQMMPDGAEAERSARFYGIVDGDHMWMIRCLGPADGAADAAFDFVVASVELDDA